MTSNASISSFIDGALHKFLGPQILSPHCPHAASHPVTLEVSGTCSALVPAAPIEKTGLNVREVHSFSDNIKWTSICKSPAAAGAASMKSYYIVHSQIGTLVWTSLSVLWWSSMLIEAFVP